MITPLRRSSSTGKKKEVAAAEEEAETQAQSLRFRLMLEKIVSAYCEAGELDYAAKAVQVLSVRGTFQSFQSTTELLNVILFNIRQEVTPFFVLLK
jgi:hypothetical protein